MLYNAAIRFQISLTSIFNRIVYRVAMYILTVEETVNKDQFVYASKHCVSLTR